jgi:hypothetical protein
MKRGKWACWALGGVVLLSAGMARGQEGPPPPDVMREIGTGGPGPFADRVELMGFEGLHGNRVVKGAPFSATASTETAQTLQDGTSIHRTTTSALFRDSQGRSRSEVTLAGFGPLQAGKTRTMITIADPVAGVHYVLDPEGKVAHQTVRKGLRGAMGGPSPEEEQAFQLKMQQRLQKDEAAGLVKKESLGTQVIGGVSAEGTRTTRTIPVGQIGNDRPIQIVFERWYSPELQVVVKSVRTDPRFGTTVYTLTNVQRTEPTASLFTVPAGYTVQQGGPGRGDRAARVPPGGPAPE